MPEYGELQSKMSIEVGDKVTIISKARYKEQGWEAVWLEEMDNTIGMVGEVENIDSYSGILVTLSDGRQYNYPFFVLSVTKTEEDQPIELPFKKGKYWATDSQVDSLRKWMEDNCDTNYDQMGNIPWAVVDAEGAIIYAKKEAPCLGSLLSNNKRPFNLGKSPVVFLHIMPRYANTNGMTRKEIKDYHTYISKFSPFVPYIVHIEDKEMSKHFIGIRLRDVPTNIPLIVSTHLRMPWDYYQMDIGDEYHALCEEMPELTPSERLVLASMIHADDPSIRDRCQYETKVNSGGHALWGGAADPHAFKEYLNGEFMAKRFDETKFTPYKGNGTGCENAMAKKYNSKASCINDFLKNFFGERCTNKYGHVKVSDMCDKEVRIATYNNLLAAIKGV